MSVPTIVVTPTAVPTSFQIATPFSYTFSNSGPYTPPANVTPPTYSGNSNEIVISNTSPYTPEYSLISSKQAGQTSINAITGLNYAMSNINNGSVFAHDLPYISSHVNTGQIWFFSGFQLMFSYSGGNSMVNVQYPLHSSNFTYSQGDSAQYTVTGSSVNVLLQLSSGNQTFGPFTPTNMQFTLCNLTWQLQSNLYMNFTVTAPDLLTPPKGATVPYLTASSLTSPELLPFISGSGTTLMRFESSTGFQSIPTSNLTLWVAQTYSNELLHSNVTSNIVVSPISITVTPSLPNPLQLTTYQPFSYSYSIPSNLVNVTLHSNSNTTSNSLAQYIASDGTSFSSTVGIQTPGVTTLEIDAILNGITVIASNAVSISTTSTNVTVTPSIPTGSLNLYKYEPFSYVFAIDQTSKGLALQFNRSASELQSFCTLSTDGQTVTFAGSFNTSYSSILSLIVDLVFEDTTVSTTTILILVNSARFFPPALNQNYQLYQNEAISNTFGSNIVFSTVQPVDSIVTIPSLPSGLSFGGSCNSWYIQGAPVLKTSQSNYQVIGSNSSNGRIVITTISARVNSQIVRITPNFSEIKGLTVDTPITSITFVGMQPQTIYATTFQYYWSSLPDGFVFQFPSGSNVYQASSPKDPVLAILEGAPSLAFANAMAASGGNLYQTRLTGTQTDQSGKQTTGTALINFSFDETVLINVSNTTLLYQTKPLLANDVVITAGSFFSSSTISNITVDSLPPGLSLVQYTSPTVYHLVGTPTTVNLTGSYTFTATNYNENSRSITVTIPINPDVVTFNGDTPADGTEITFIVSRLLTSAKTGYYTTPIGFTATSTASATPIVYSASIDFTAYGLALNSSTGALTGIPTVSLPQTTVSIYATDYLGTVGTTTIKLTIAADVFVWPAYAPTFFQNRTMTPYQFVMTSTLSERLIQSYSSSDLPLGLSLNPSGILSGTPRVYPVGGTGVFTVTATTGYSTLSQIYIYTMISDGLLILQTNGTDIVSPVFSNVAYQAIEYSTDSVVNATFSIGSLTPSTTATIAITSGGLLSGNFTTATLGVTYQAILTAVYGTVTSTTQIYILFTSSSGTIHIPTELSELSFVEPTQSSFTLFQYVPYTIPIEAIGSSSFIYYYTTSVPIGFEFLPDATGTRATLSGISPTLATQGVNVYAKTSTGYPISKSIALNTITPFFVNPQTGAGAYTALLRNDVEANAAQNARDNKVFPQVDPLAGPIMAPRAPDVVTPDDCFLKLCKKPCPTCRS